MIQLETVDQCKADILPLLEEHWREVALYQHAVKLEPDWDRYRQIEEQGRLAAITARKDGALLGYSVFFLDQHLHYKSCRTAVNDVIFLRKDARGFLGAKLLMGSERILRGLGVQRVMWHIKPEHDWTAVLARMGYQHEEIVLGKLLEQ